MNRNFLLATVVLAGVTSVTSVRAQDWAGFYGGISLGYNFQPSDSDETILFDTNLDGRFADNVNTAAGANAFSPGFCGGRAGGPRPTDGCSNEKDGAELSARLGYDWQFDNFVVGALVDVTSYNINDSVSAFSTTPARYTMTREINWSAALRARAGVAAQSALLYATGGLVRGDLSHSFSTSNTVNTFTLSGGDNANGYQFGAGVEWALSGNWRVGAEYLNTKLDDDDHRVRSSGPAPATNPFILVNASGTDFARSADNFTFNTIRLTLTYRFGS